MAALMTSMRFIGKTSQLRNIRTFKRLLHCYNKKVHIDKICARARRLAVHSLPAQNCVCLYTSNAKDSLTDDILKSKIGTSEPSQNEKADSGTDSGKKADGKKKNWFQTYGIYIGLGSIGMSALVAVVIMGMPPKDPDGKIIKDEFSDLNPAIALFKRAFSQMKQTQKMIQEPSRAKLLPDPLQYPYIQPPYTLVLEMTGVLVHPEWTYSTGWRFKKRPGIEQFLKLVKPPLFEVVIFTSEQGLNADPIVTALDPEGYIMYRLYRDATRYTDGHHVKDLSCLNRDLSKVIMVDWDNKAVTMNPENFFQMKKWKGEDDDKDLVDLGLFLQNMAVHNVQDVRPVLEYYSQFDDPIAKFTENQKKLQEEHQAKLQQQDKASKSLIPQSPSWFRRR